MNKKNFFRPIMLAIGVLALQSGRAQVSTASNSPGIGDYLGCDGLTTFPLEVRHNGNYPIEWYTDSIQRMELYETRNNETLNGFTVLDHSGYLGLSGHPAFFNTNVPFSRFHLADTSSQDIINAQQFGFRPWQRNGITFTGNADHGYFGQEFNGLDTTDMVLMWSNDYGTGQFSPDHLSIRFGSNYNMAASGASSMQGLESMRFFPVDRTQVNVGIGDWFAGNLADPTITEPAERLDVLDGRVRIRQLPTDLEADTLDQYMVVDPTGVVGWRNLPVAATSNCEWVPDASTLHLSTSYLPVGTNGSCPDRRWKVGIGVLLPDYKLDIDHTASENASLGAIRARFTTTTGGTATGASVTVSPPSSSNLHTGWGVNSLVNSPTAFGAGTNGSVLWDQTGTYDSKAVGAGGSVQVTGGSVAFGYGVKADLIATSGTVSQGYGLLSTATGNATMSNAYGVNGSVNCPGAVNSYGGALGATASGSSNVTWNVGLDAIATHSGSGTAGLQYGVAALSQTSGTGQTTQSIGLYARSLRSAGSATISDSYGIYATAANGTRNYAIWAQVADTSANTWAGYFTGKVRITGNGYVSGTTFITSDENLKSNIEDITNASEIVAQLQPKTYTFRTDEHPGLGLPRGPQIGLLAQELQQVLPQLVETVVDPEVRDSLGNVVFEQETTHAVNYLGLIPVLIGAAKEQQAEMDEMAATTTGNTSEIEELRNRLDQLEQLLVECCNRPTPDGLRENTPTGTPILNDTEGDRKLRIQPNPFSESTTVYYTLERGGRAQLMANSADGKQLRVLQEANLESGDYQFNWNTADLAAGMYYVTLLLDGQPVVKKAVKVNR